MSIKGKAYIVGAFEHPTRKATDKSVAQLHAECAYGALPDAGLSKDDIDGYFCAGDAPGLGPLSMADYMGLTSCRHLDTTDIGGCSYIAACGHAAEAIAAGQVHRRADHAGRPAARRGHGHGHRAAHLAAPARRTTPFEMPYGRHRRNMLRHVRHAAHVRVRHHLASSSPGSRSPPATTPSTTRTPCCARSSPSRRW